VSSSSPHLVPLLYYRQWLFVLLERTGNSKSGRARNHWRTDPRFRDDVPFWV